MKTGTVAPMQALNFMAGDWELDYTVTQQGRTSSPFRGTGSLRYLFDATYLTFDYQMQEKDTGEIIGGAHGIFAWDPQARLYRYYWFESSGNFHQATASLRDDDTLAMEWQQINCTQIFRRVSARAMYLEMHCPDQDLLLRVDFARVAGAAQRSEIHLHRQLHRPRGVLLLRYPAEVGVVDGQRRRSLSPCVFSIARTGAEACAALPSPACLGISPVAALVRVADDPGPVAREGRLRTEIRPLPNDSSSADTFPAAPRD